MSDLMNPLPIDRLLKMIFNEFENKKSIFGISKDLFFEPKKNEHLYSRRFGQLLETPLGVAAGPHSQLAQNIIASWLVGARYIELKTVQTLDELEVSKPCIDMEDEGFNCEWSQELKLHDSFSEYLNAWIIIHILKEKLQINNKHNELGVIFNMSVGYNMEGILKPNVQEFFSKMNDSSDLKKEAIAKLKDVYPAVNSLNIPDQISNNITLSTMHGCPPDEIEKIGLYLIEEKKLHTTIKLNPTLNGSDKLRDILNNKLGFSNVVIPDIAFEHDLKYPDAISLLKNLRSSAEKEQVHFGIKLTNTLESTNNKNIFDKSNEMMYMSGRGLHALAINLAGMLRNDLGEDLDISFSSGADAFNISDTLACNLTPVTVCTDILKPGGYGRLAQYIEMIDVNNKQNLKDYFEQVISDKRYHKSSFPWNTIKTERKLDPFNCVAAPCESTCPSKQNIPEYMYLTSVGKYDEALNVIRETNPFPYSTGLACDHICEDKCTRLNYDSTIKIRDIKRFLTSKEGKVAPLAPKTKLNKSVAIIGAGPSGLSCAFFLALEGFNVEVFEEKSEVGGMLTHAIPAFRIDKERVNRDIERITSLGVKINTSTKVSATNYSKIKEEFDYVYIATGAPQSKALGIDGEDSEGVVDFLSFLETPPKQLPKKVAVIGGGNSAIDVVRTAKRLMPKDGELNLIYRRTVKQMPAAREEIEELLEENISVMELTAPQKIISQSGKLAKLECIKMELSAADESGRARPVPVKGSEFELELGYLIKAIGQNTLNPFWNLEDGKVYIGGDAERGASSIIKGIADGKNVAFSIMEKESINRPQEIKGKKDITIEQLRAKRARRGYGPELPKIEDRDSFNLVVTDLQEAAAKEEADRCLYCDELCEVCVTVCPNRANIAYEAQLQKHKISNIKIENKQVSRMAPSTFEISQKNQVLNIGDFCNECGNCMTFCPTNGKPYTDKPKIYLSETTFNAESSNAYFVDKETIFAKFDDSTWSFNTETNQLDNELIKLKVNPETFDIDSIVEIKKDGDVDLTKVAAMKVIFDATKDLV